MSASQPSPPPRPTPVRPLSPADEQLWSVLAHVGNVLWFLLSLLILLILGPRSTRVRQEAKEALNASITATIAWVVLQVAGAVVGAVGAHAPIGIDLLFILTGGLISLLQFAVWVLLVVLSVVAAVRVSSGGGFRYPLALRLIS